MASTDKTILTEGQLSTLMTNIKQGMTLTGTSDPTTATVGKVGQIYLNTATGKLFVMTGIVEESGQPDTYTWAVAGGGGGGAIALSEADLDYPTGNPTSLKTWDLAPGIYNFSNGTNSDITIWVTTNNYFTAKKSKDITFAIFRSYVNGVQTTRTVVFDDQNRYILAYDANTSDGSAVSGNVQSHAYILTRNDIVNNVTSTSTVKPLSANQGRVLDEKIENRIINGGTTAPTTSTVGSVGTLYSYVDTTGTTPEPHLLTCTAVTTDTSVTPNVTTYTWTDLLGSVTQILHQINNGSN